ncbi:MAG: hypothetical protein V3V16_10935 [Melioribacteraceae bacterium]
MNAIESFFRDYKTTLSFTLTFIGLVIAYLTFDSYINTQIDNKIKDTEYIQKLSKTLRPFLIFENKGMISYDHGASKFVDSINVQYFPYDSTKGVNLGWPKEMIIYTNQFLATPPLLDYIGVFNFTYSIKRNKNGWLIKTKPIVIITDNFGRVDSRKPWHENIYILEILL